MSPRRAWTQGCEQFPVRPAPPADVLRVLLAKDDDAYVHHYGVEWKNQIYKDKGRQLGAWIPHRKSSVKVKIKYDPADLSVIWILDEDNLRFIRAEAENQAYTRGLSEKQHQHERALALQQYGADDQEKLNMVEAGLARRYHETPVEKGRTFKIAPPREREDHFAAYEDRPQVEATDLNSFTPRQNSRDIHASRPLPASTSARAEPSLATPGAQANRHLNRAPAPNDDDRQVLPSLQGVALETSNEPAASAISHPRNAERLDIEERIRRHKVGLKTYQEIPPTSLLADTAGDPSQPE